MIQWMAARTVARTWWPALVSNVDHGLQRGWQLEALLGAGRAKKNDGIDLTAGIRLHRRCGDFVQAGDLLATLYFKDGVDPTPARRNVEEAIAMGTAAKQENRLVIGIMDETGWNSLE